MTTFGLAEDGVGLGETSAGRDRGRRSRDRGPDREDHGRGGRDPGDGRQRRRDHEGRAARPPLASPWPDAPLLELRGITKRFPGVVANDDVDFELAPGEVHALLGENGAGKSTLMNILYGLYHPDEGEIRLHGKPVRISSPREAIDLGIGMVHQHFMLIPVMTVAENIVLGERADGTARSSISTRRTSASRDISRALRAHGRPEGPRRVDQRRASSSGSRS